MEITLEIRWFIQGMPPSVVQRWFSLECPGKLLAEPENKEDLYFYGNLQDWDRLQFACLYLKPNEDISLKLRQGNLELKQRQQEVEIRKFGNPGSKTNWEGKIEKWCKYTQQDLIRHQEFFERSKPDLENCWIPVSKQRQQRSYQGVKCELTFLRVNNSRWWTLAFEMVENERYNRQNFERVVDMASQTYYGPQLSIDDSYSYNYWLLQFILQSIFFKSKN